jgi:hypothetical protein
MNRIGCLLIAVLCGCASTRQEVAINLQFDPAMPQRTGKVDIIVHLVK